MNIMEFIKPELLILIPVIYFIGIAFKKSQCQDKFIPLFLGIVGIVLAVVWVLATSVMGTYQDVLMAVFVAITQGVLCSGCSVYANQFIKQNKKVE